MSLQPPRTRHSVRCQSSASCISRAFARASRCGDHINNLIQPGGSNYDVAVLWSNLQRLDLSMFPLTPSDIEGSAGKSAVVGGSRLGDLFRDHIIREGAYQCIGYILRIPSHGGHWVSILPATLSVDVLPTIAAVLCDSMWSLLLISPNDVPYILIFNIIPARDPKHQ